MDTPPSKSQTPPVIPALPPSDVAAPFLPYQSSTLTSPQAPPQISEDHLKQVIAAGEGLRKIRRVIAVARFDGISIAVFAGLTILLSFTSLPGLALGLAMGVVAFIELRAIPGLQRLNPQAARTLAINQIALATMLICYCLYRIRVELGGGGELAAISAGDPDVAKLLAPYEDSARLAALLIYGAVIAVAVFAQGGLAAYYFSRRRHIEDYVARTPAWVIALQRANGSI